jgi:hypothetical protein
MDLREKLKFSQFCWDDLSDNRGELLKKGKLAFMGGIFSDRLEHCTIEFKGACCGREDCGKAWGQTQKLAFKARTKDYLALGESKKRSQ